MQISLDQLEVLEAIAQAGSFAHAALALHKVQSAVSYSVRQLEETLGVVLFDRSGHKAALTDAGRSVLAESRALLDGARALQTLGERLRGGYEPRLELVVDGALPMRPILAAMRRLADEGAPTHVRVKVEYLGGVVDAFERDDADVMIASVPVERPSLLHHALPPLEMVLCASRTHPLAAASGPLSLAELRAHVELTIHDTAESQRRADPFLFGGPRVFYLGDFHTKREALRMGLGYGWMPRYLVEPELRSGALVVLRTRARSRRRLRPALVHRESRALGKTGARLLEILVEKGGWAR